MDSVYVWRTEGVEDGLYDGSIDDPEPIEIGLFWHHKPLKESYLEWRELKGVKNALTGNNDDKEFVDVCKRTVKWVENGCLDPIGYHVYHKESLDRDVLFVPYSVPCVNQKVVDILQQVCPNEIEVFDAKLNFDTPKKFYLINITNGLYEDAFIKNGLGPLSICRLIKKEQLRYNASKILLSRQLTEIFKDEKIQGLRHLKYGENPYAA